MRKMRKYLRNSKKVGLDGQSSLKCSIIDQYNIILILGKSSEKSFLLHNLEKVSRRVTSISKNSRMIFISLNIKNSS